MRAPGGDRMDGRDRMEAALLTLPCLVLLEPTEQESVWFRSNGKCVL